MKNYWTLMQAWIDLYTLECFCQPSILICGVQIDWYKSIYKRWLLPSFTSGAWLNSSFSHPCAAFLTHGRHYDKWEVPWRLPSRDQSSSDFGSKSTSLPGRLLYACQYRVKCQLSWTQFATNCKFGKNWTTSDCIQIAMISGTVMQKTHCIKLPY